MYKEIFFDQYMIKPINAIWLYKNCNNNKDTIRIVPDACSDIIFSISDKQSSPIFIGYMTEYKEFSFESDETILGIRFNPGFSYHILKTELLSFTNKSCYLDHHTHKDIHSIHEDIINSKKIDALKIHDAIINIINSNPINPKIYYAIQRCISFKGNIKIKQLSEHVGLSQRSLQINFLTYLGMPPKMFCRILRFKNYYKSQECKGADFALTNGFYDQSHFIKDFKYFSGKSPFGK